MNLNLIQADFDRKFGTTIEITYFIGYFDESEFWCIGQTSDLKDAKELRDFDLNDNNIIVKKTSTFELLD